MPAKTHKSQECSASLVFAYERLETRRDVIDIENQTGPILSWHITHLIMPVARAFPFRDRHGAAKSPDQQGGDSDQGAAP